MQIIYLILPLFSISLSHQQKARSASGGPSTSPWYPPNPWQTQNCNALADGHKAYYWTDWWAYHVLPSTTVYAGVDKDKSQIYVGRAFHEGMWIPAKVIPEKNIAWVAYDGQEHKKTEFQILREQHFDWIPTTGRNIPPGAVEGGRTLQGEPLYIGRVRVDGTYTVGKVQTSKGLCYVPYGGYEKEFPDYEILVLRL